MQTPTRSNSDTGSPKPTAKVRASTILGEFEQAQAELVGKAVILTDGKAGTVESVWLDEMHGLRISIRGLPWEVAYLHHQIRAAGLKSDLGCGIVERHRSSSGCASSSSEQSPAFPPLARGGAGYRLPNGKWCQSQKIVS
jgi:hypothetical protein